MTRLVLALACLAVLVEARRRRLRAWRLWCLPRGSSRGAGLCAEPCGL